MASPATVLITGGSGMIGTRLTTHLLQAGYRVTHLSRHPSAGKVKTYRWDITRQEIDPEAITTADHIIHLAGAGIADGRWTAKRKQHIMDSRVDTVALLVDALQRNPHRVQSFVSASAIGYYGNRGNTWLTEDSAPGQQGFMEQVCVAWEQAADRVAALDIRTVKLRIGLVMSAAGGALPKMTLPMRFGLAPYFGSGRQYYSWIHIDDLCRMFAWAISHTQMTGPYNAVAPHPLPNKAFIQTVKTALHRPALMVPAPAFALRMVLGEMADTVLYSARVRGDKIYDTGFAPEYPHLQQAVQQLYHR